MSETEFEWIDSAARLQQKVADWCQEPAIALDTEFMRSNTYYAEAGLIQLADAQSIYLIDPLALADEISVLAPLLSSPDTLKIMHSMSEDIELLHQLCGVEPKSVFDTQIAAAFLAYGPALGYQKLVETVLGLELDKSETRSDWLQRPLSTSQLHYAAKDVEYLLEIYTILRQQLEEKMLFGAVMEEAQNLISANLALAETDSQAYLKLRGAWELPLEKQQLLQSLVSWRDQLARSENVPKPWVFHDQQLIVAARLLLQSQKQLWKLEGVKPKSIRLYGDALLQQISDFEFRENDDFEVIEKPVKGKEFDLYKKLKKEVDKVAAASGIAPQLLGSRKMLERVVIHCVRHERPELPDEFLGWRAAFLKDALLNSLSHNR